MSPRAYGEAVRLRSLKSRLRAGAAVTDAIYAAGFGSEESMRRAFTRELTTTPAAYRRRFRTTRFIAHDRSGGASRWVAALDDAA